MDKPKQKIDDISLMLLKLEAAEELGLKEKVKKVGWGGLTSEETGKLGGYITSKINKKKKKDEDENEMK